MPPSVYLQPLSPLIQSLCEYFNMPASPLTWGALVSEDDIIWRMTLLRDWQKKFDILTLHLFQQQTDDSEINGLLHVWIKLFDLRYKNIIDYALSDEIVKDDSLWPSGFHKYLHLIGTNGTMMDYHLDFQTFYSGIKSHHVHVVLKKGTINSNFFQGLFQVSQEFKTQFSRSLEYKIATEETQKEIAYNFAQTMEQQSCATIWVDWLEMLLRSTFSLMLILCIDQFLGYLLQSFSIINHQKIAVKILLTLILVDTFFEINSAMNGVYLIFSTCRMLHASLLNTRKLIDFIWLTAACLLLTIGACAELSQMRITDMSTWLSQQALESIGLSNPPSAVFSPTP